jgi:endoribonuclease Dicer
MVAAAVAENALIVLPTGAGKTHIACECILRLGPPVLFLAPTRLLVVQQAAVLAAYTGLRVARYSDGSVLPREWDVLVATPAMVEAGQGAGEAALSWAAFTLVVFDEVHHTLGRHPYAGLARGLRAAARSSQRQPRVLGLTASLTYAFDRDDMAEAIRTLARELGITAAPLTASTEELRHDGYHASAIPPTMRLRCHEVALPDDGDPPGVLPRTARREAAADFWRRVHEGSATTLARFILTVVREATALLNILVAEQLLLPPEPEVREWAAAAHAAAVAAGPGAHPILSQLEHYCEALWQLVVSWEVAQDLALSYLRMVGAHMFDAWPAPLGAAMARFWGRTPATFPRFEHLKRVLGDLLAERGPAGLRAVVFVQQRLMVHVLGWVIDTDAGLAGVLHVALMYSAASPATPALRISKSGAAAALAAFGSGAANVLITTCVAEEGLDVPAANAVVRFDPMHTPVSYVQGRGRARAADSSYVILEERRDRTAARLAEAEVTQHELCGGGGGGGGGGAVGEGAASLSAGDGLYAEAAGVEAAAAEAPAVDWTGAPGEGEGLMARRPPPPPRAAPGAHELARATLLRAPPEAVCDAFNRYVQDTRGTVSWAWGSGEGGGLAHRAELVYVDGGAGRTLRATGAAVRRQEAKRRAIEYFVAQLRALV